MEKYKLIQVILNNEYTLKQLRGLGLVHNKPLVTVKDYENFINIMLAENPTSLALTRAKEDFQYITNLHQILIRSAHGTMDSLITELIEYSNNLQNDDLKQVLEIIKEIPKLKPLRQVEANTYLTVGELREQVKIIRNNNKLK